MDYHVHENTVSVYLLRKVVYFFLKENALNLGVWLNRGLNQTKFLGVQRNICPRTVLGKVLANFLDLLFDFHLFFTVKFFG